MNVHRIHVPIPRQCRGKSRHFWTRDDVDPGRVIVNLNASAIADVHRMIAKIRRQPLPLFLWAPDQFDIPNLRQAMRHARTLLDQELGVVIVDRLPLDEFSVDEARILAWCLGRLIDRPVAQKWDGTMLYDVADFGKSLSDAVRGSRTNAKLDFHTDNAFGAAIPDYVGLMCLRPAMEGGVSRFCSLAAVHDRMLTTTPRLLARLYQPTLWNRQSEHLPDAPKVARLPMFSLERGRFRARANIRLIYKGHRVVGEPMDSELDEALSTFQATANDPEMWFELAIERGQLQYLANIDIAHYRSGFRDYPDSGLKRHLVRTWHRRHGHASYDG